MLCLNCNSIISSKKKYCSNKILLCPNCHSLTSTYKGANINHGRKTRNKYYIGKEE